MEKIKLSATKRTTAGRKVKKLRKEGILPANIYGKKVASLAVQVDKKEFNSIFIKAGETGLVELTVGEKVHPVLIHNVQFNPVTEEPLHVDFLQVDLKEKVTTKVPVHLVGEAQAVKDKIGVLLTLLSEVEVEALPADLPEKIEVKIDGLSAINQTVKVSDLKVSDKVKILSSAELDVVKVAPLVSKEAEKMAKEEQEAAAAAAAATQATVPSPGASTTEVKEETKKEETVTKTPPPTSSESAKK